jgi:hypothetical protein
MPAGDEVQTPFNTLAPPSHIVSNAVSQLNQLAAGRVTDLRAQRKSFWQGDYDFSQFCLIAKRLGLIHKDILTRIRTHVQQPYEAKSLLRN